jgi:hypothetical protein
MGPEVYTLQLRAPIELFERLDRWRLQQPGTMKPSRSALDREPLLVEAGPKSGTAENPHAPINKRHQGVYS